MSRNPEPLAIVGLGCRFPGGSDGPEAFWQMLCDGIDAICDVPTDRWDIRKFYDPDPASPGRMCTRQGGFLRESIWDFDAAFFGISPREAAVMDPQQRLLLETTWDAFEHAGLALEEAQRRRMGVYVGAFCFDNALQQMGVLSRDSISSNSAASASMVMLSNRISHVFDLQGPSFTVDTACSSSLVAAHLGCRSLWDGECDIAVIAGVNIMLRPESTIIEAKGGFLARDARCRAFDSAASGYARGEGAGVVVVRPLSVALAAGDRIIALVRGSGINQDGRTPGITVPNGTAQENLIGEVCAYAGIDPGEIGYVEAHGTGTQVGDPIEANAIGHAIGQRKRDEPVWVGSVKTIIGHLEAGAGVAGMMKAALCLAHQQVPPHLHLVNSNAKIDFSALGLRVPNRLEKLSPILGRFAAINSFGYGGTNAHMILERAPAIEAKRVNSGVGPWLLPLSARANGARDEFALALAQQVISSPDVDLAAFGHALGVRRPHHDHRVVVIARNRDHFVEQLRRLPKGGRDPALRVGQVVGSARLVWVFAGMGAQWWGMGRGLFRDSSVFREAIVACDAAWRRTGGVDELQAMFNPAIELSATFGDPMLEPRHAQPANLALQVGVTTVLRSLGMEADAIVGHSVGEIGAAWAAGVFTLDDAFTLIYHRSRLQQEHLGRGTMLFIALQAATARQKILELAPDVEIAAFNDEESVTLGGAAEQLRRISAWADENSVRAQMIQVGVAYHTRQMEPMHERFMAALSGLRAAPPCSPLYSTVTGRRVYGGELTAEYWWRNVREPVLLTDALEQLRRDGCTAFLEVGPHAALTGSIIRSVPGAHAWPSQRRGSEELPTLLAGVGDCYCAGVALDWRQMYPHHAPELRAPRYPFQRQTLWRETPESRADRLVEEFHPLLHQRLAGPQPVWKTTLNERFLPWLPDHKVLGVTIFPGAGYAVAALAAADQCERGNSVEDLTFHRALYPQSQTELRIELDPRDGYITLNALAPEEDARWQMHATGRLPEGRFAAGTPLDVAAIRARCAVDVDVTALYRQLAILGLQYGPRFQCIRSIRAGVDEALVELYCDDPDSGQYPLHPALLDAAFHAALAISSGEAPVGTYVPVHIRAVRQHAPTRATIFAQVKVMQRHTSSLLCDIRLVDSEGAAVAEVEGVRFQQLATEQQDTETSAPLYAWSWEQVATRESSPPTDEQWLLISGRPNLAASLSAAARDLAGLSLAVVAEGEASARLCDSTSWTGVVDLRAFDLDVAGDPTGELACNALLQLVREVASSGLAMPPRLVIVTRGAVPVGSQLVEPAAGALWALGRVAMTERPELRVKLIDVDEHKLDANRLLAETREVDEEEVALRAATRYVPRLDRWRPKPAKPTTTSLNMPLRLKLGTPGVIDSLHWIPDSRHPPEQGQVEIRVHSASLNFKDLLKALNMLSASYVEKTFIGNHIGMECAGTVVAVGEGVDDYKPGDQVIVIDTGGCFRTYRTVSTCYMAHKPASLSFAAAPSLIAYVTPYYAMHYLAHVQQGETVLIHSASGGVGQAGIQIARSLGAKIIATAGSDAKREFLRTLGVEHVLDSRSLEFVKGVRAITGGSGVDVVLNSLSGEAARQSLGLLAPYGRFLEIGKKDIGIGNTLGLADFERSLMYVAIDTDRMGRERPALFRKLINEVIAMIAGGKFGPVTTEGFAASEIQEAFRTMARARHIGKISIDLESGETPVLCDHGVVIDPNRTWLVTGGLGGFGLKTAEWLVEQGCRALVLIGRSGASRPEAHVAIERMRAGGAVVEALALDIADRTAVDALLARFSACSQPLQGIVHAATILDDGPIESLDPNRLAAVMGPKARGAWNLHEASKSTAVEAFVMFSSIATYIGNAGQASYIAANGFLDALAWHRRALGLPALTVNWGAIGDVGLVARSQATAAYLDRIGVLTINSANCVEVLGTLLRHDAVQVGVAQMNWERWADSSVHVASSPRFSKVVAAGRGSTAEHPAIKELRSLNNEERLARVQSRIRDQLGRVTHQDCELIDVNMSLDNMGVDSLMGVELTLNLRRELGVDLSILPLIMRELTVSTLAGHVLASLSADGSQAIVGASPPSDEPNLNVDTMSEAELDRLLAAGGDA
ncbi:acyl transferase domain-containing protein [Paraburkholderia sp. BL18I3N2]|uniref:type I polyketide synthase n=1 Tax=unclassified Paraburkholderia TaxID=2615204 RepID=UPI000D05DFF7|nr:MULTISPECIES: type I polyketide synthase [unclassified Paraburkholderia]PRX24032.1 acyl transferase domain-containing protein [Paraburkholderia sp. BL18I3N2]PRX87520.1 acyl transferase domain-containing protein [Paraburkholderia sp. BL25I1N1]